MRSFHGIRGKLEGNNDPAKETIDLYRLGT